MIRACFVREERDHLVVAPGVRESWRTEADASFGPTLTRFGKTTITVKRATQAGRATVVVEGDWRQPPRLEIQLPGFTGQTRATTKPREEFQLEAMPS
jgi:hypothetical protein